MTTLEQALFKNTTVFWSTYANIVVENNVGTRLNSQSIHLLSSGYFRTHCLQEIKIDDILSIISKYIGFGECRIQFRVKNNKNNKQKNNDNHNYTVIPASHDSHTIFFSFLPQAQANESSNLKIKYEDSYSITLKLCAMDCKVGINSYRDIRHTIEYGLIKIPIDKVIECKNQFPALETQMLSDMDGLSILGAIKSIQLESYYIKFLFSKFNDYYATRFASIELDSKFKSKNSDYILRTGDTLKIIARRDRRANRNKDSNIYRATLMKSGKNMLGKHVDVSNLIDEVSNGRIILNLDKYYYFFALSCPVCDCHYDVDGYVFDVQS